MNKNCGENLEDIGSDEDQLAEHTDTHIEKDKEEGNDVKKTTEDEEEEEQLGNRDTKSTICEYLLCSSSTWEAEETLNTSHPSLVTTYSSQQFKYKYDIKIDDDEDTHTHEINTSCKTKNMKRRWSSTQSNTSQIKYHKDRSSSKPVKKKKTHVEQMYANDIDGRMPRKRKKTESLERNKLTSAETLTTERLHTKWLLTKNVAMTGSSTGRNLTLAETLTRKRLKLVKKSKLDIMSRRQRSEVIKELRQYKEEEMKKIDLEVKGMKRDLLAYMLKEVEEHKKTMLMNMEKGIEEEKNRRLRRIEYDLASKVCDDKCIQTMKYPQTVDEKYEDILKELKDIKHSSRLCKNILTKHLPLDTKFNVPDTFHKSSSTSEYSSNLSISEDSASMVPSSTQHLYYKTSWDKPKVSSKSEVKSSNKSSQRNTSYEDVTLSYENINNSVNVMSSEEFLSGKNFANYSSDNICSYSKRSENNSPENPVVYHHYRSPQDNITVVRTDIPCPPQQDTTLYSSSPYSQEQIPPNKKLLSQDIGNIKLMVSKDNNTSNKQSVSQQNRPYLKNSTFVPIQNTSTSNKNSTLPLQNTASYIKTLLSSEENTLLCNQTSTSTVPTENTATYIKKLLISSQLESQETTPSNNNQNITDTYSSKNTHSTKPTLLSSQDTALYIKNLLLASHKTSSRKSHHDNSALPKKTYNIFNKETLNSSQENTSLYSRPNTQPNTLISNKKMKFPNTENFAYNIYTYNKNLISSQEDSKLFRNIDDIRLITVRKKREISKRILEKYGPLLNPAEVSDNIQSDPIFLSLPIEEKNGILSCLTRSVAEPFNLSKDLLEELFSREVLSISSCKGSPIKTALNADKLALIRRIVFFALPSDEEEAMWEMIQECIDTKCRGILRNMKKKLSRSFEC